MERDETNETTIMRPRVDLPGEICLVEHEEGAEIRRLFSEERVSMSEIGRRMDVDRKPVRRSLRPATLLMGPADFVRDRAPRGNYSARILYQELRASRGDPGSSETVKR